MPRAKIWQAKIKKKKKKQKEECVESGATDLTKVTSILHLGNLAIL